MLLKKWTGPIAATLLALGLPALAIAQVSLSVSVNVPPPELPVYEQPPIPDEGYIWTPGYWAWNRDSQDYYWVPGTWVPAPQPGYLWTPGFWAVEGVAFTWHTGYWGPHVGFYGGVNYGHGYGGEGYEGGYWQGGHMYYNRSVNNISNTHITNVYNKTVVNNVTVNRVSYNGGNGVHARPTAADEAAAREQHVAVTPVQRQHEQTARSNPQLRVAQNKGHPPIAATARPVEHGGAVSGAAESHPASPTGEAPSTQPKHATTHEAPANHEAPNHEPPANHGSAPHEPPAQAPHQAAPAPHQAAPAPHQAAPAPHPTAEPRAPSQPHPPQAAAPKPAPKPSAEPHQEHPPEHNKDDHEHH